MPVPRKFEAGEKLGCFTVIEKKENHAGAKTRGDYNIWICTCTNTDCEARKPECDHVERTVKQLNDMSEKCKDAKMPYVPREKTDKRIFDFRVNAYDILSTDALKSKIKSKYGFTLHELDMESLKRIFEDLYDDLFIKPLNMVEGAKISRLETNPTPTDWRIIVYNYRKHIEGQLNKINKYIAERTTSEISNRIREYITSELKRNISLYKYNFPNYDDFTAYALYINSVLKDGCYDSMDEKRELVFYHRSEIKDKYVKKFISIVKGVCAEAFTDALNEEIEKTVEVAVNNNAFASRLINVERINMGIGIVYVKNKNPENNLPDACVRIIDMSELKV